MTINYTRVSEAIRSFRLVIISLLSLAVAVSASGYTLIHGFAGAPSDGAGPENGSPVTDGTFLYGLTANGGVSNNGTLFKVSTDGTEYQVLHSFTGNTNDGANPCGTPLLIGSTLYGMTFNGGTYGFGAIFQINTNGNDFQLLYSFDGLSSPDGENPYGSLVTDGTNLFGLTSASSPITHFGTIFMIGTNGTGYQVFRYFGGNSGGDGALPRGSLMLSDGILYGMTALGGTAQVGTIFQINTDGSNYQKIHDFAGAPGDGAIPYGSLVASGSTLYGMSTSGGSNNLGAVFSVDANGNTHLLHSFSSSELFLPLGHLTLSNATLYGTASAGGGNGLGGVFQINTDGSGYQPVYAFSYASNNLTDGATPQGSLLLSGGQLYGMTLAGGSSDNAGTVFSLGSGGSSAGGGAVGALTVTILPAGAIAAGAQWAMDGGNVYDSGTTITNVSVGEHTVFFSDVSGWTTAPSQNVTISDGATAFVTGTYTQIQVTTPTLTVGTPTAGLRVSNGVFTATGASSDTIPISGVYYQLNGDAWNLAATANNWTNWSATNLNLAAGTNTFSAYAMDTNNNVSATNSVSFLFVVSDQLVVMTKGGAGTIKPNLNGMAEPMGKTLTMTAKAAKGFEFVGWSGSISTNSAKLTFVMASNLQFTANFKDIARPVNAILSPRKNQVVTSSAPVASGKAKDNVGVTSVWFAVNGGGWMPANLPDGTNWTTPTLTLLSGANSISAFAEDAVGNASRTNTILFKYMVESTADWAPDSLNGLLASVTPTNGAVESVGFDPSTFAQTGIAGDTNADDYGAGTYSYVKTDTNIAQLSLAFTNPPSSSNNVGPVTLVFTNHYSGYFTNAGNADTGGFNVAITTALTPAAVSGKTIIATSSNSLKTTTIKLSTKTFVKTPANNASTGTSSGNYTFTRYSPVSGMFALAFTDPADTGSTAYLQTTFTSATAGTYFVLIFDNTGTLQDTDDGRFILK